MFHEDNTEHQNQLKQLDDVIRTEFIPAIPGGINCSDIERRFISLLQGLEALKFQYFQSLHRWNTSFRPY